jgi:hypothetical protein
MGSSPLEALRRRLEHAGSDARQLGILRHELASTEDPRTLRVLAVALEEFRDYAADDSLGAISDLKDRLFEKMERVGATSPTSPTPRRSKPRRPLGNLMRTSVAPQSNMIISPWVTDDLGNLSREVYADPAGPMWRP